MSERSNPIEVNPKKLSGKPVFRGTRIPIAFLAQYLREDRTVEDFISDFDIEPELVHRVAEAID